MESQPSEALIHRSAWTFLVVLACVVCTACTGTRQEEVILARDIDVSDKVSTSITPLKPILVRLARSELWLEIPSLGGASDTTSLKNGERLQLEIIVETNEAKQLPLDNVASFDYAPRRFAVATSDRLAWRDDGQPPITITKIVLRSQPAVQIKQAIWLSYDPREFSSGVSSPEGVR